MKVTCFLDSARDLPLNPLAYNPEGDLALTAGSSYQVYGMSLYAGSLMILIRDDTGYPNWYPLPLFRVDEHHLADSWKFASFDDSAYLQALWGYAELVDDEAHYDGLLERDPGALRAFLDVVKDNDDKHENAN